MKTKLNMLSDCVNVICKAGKEELLYELVPILKFLNTFKDTDTIDVIVKQISSELAYYFGKHLENYREIMRDYVTESEWALKWAEEIGDRDVMIYRVNDSKSAFYWAVKIGDREIMINRVTESEWAYCWARDIGDRDIMRDRVTESHWAYCWARDIGDRDIMRDRVTDSYWAYCWARDIGDREIMIDRVKGLNDIWFWIDRWSKDKEFFIKKGLIEE